MPKRIYLAYFLGIFLLTAAAIINQHVVAQRPVEEMTAFIERGRPLYAAKCASCHGPRMEGGRQPVTGKEVSALDKTSFRIYFYGMPATTESYVAETIKIGDGTMPPFAGELNEKERLAVAVLIRAVNTGDARLP